MTWADDGARDDFAYVYSPDRDNAYEPGNSLVLARVPRNRLRERDAYEFFVQSNFDGRPGWSDDIRQRGAVFSHPGGCYRSSITYNAGLKRYLLI